MPQRRAFTLIELLLVIGIIGVLASIVIIAISPQSQLASAQNAKRRSSVRELQKALEQYLVDVGSLPEATSITSGGTAMICKQGVSPVGCLNFDAELVPTYLPAIPQDSNAIDSNHSGFTVKKDAQGRPLVTAAYLGTQPGASPIDYTVRWRLQDNLADATIVATSGPNAVLAGGDTTVILQTPGPGSFLSGALQFDGAADYISINPPGDMFRNVTGITFASWVKTSDANGALVYNSASVGLRFYMATQSGQLVCAALATDGESAQQVITTPTITSGTWVHVACVVNYAADTITIYINGSAAATTGTVAFTGTSTSDTVPTLFRVVASNAGPNFAAALADVRVYHRILGASEIAAIATGL